MQIGFQLMTRGAGASAEGITRIAEAGERLGFAYIAPNDHIVVPGDIASRYPYTEDGLWPGAKVGECHEQLTVLAFLAARTRRIRLLTSVMVVPQRAPVLTAKVLATADLLSNGRVTVGCGVGWLEEEFAAIGTPPFAERGAVTDEYIAVFKELWTKDDPQFDGKYARFADIQFAPKPVQKPHPPIWIGGESTAALRRAVRTGDGWYPACNNPKVPLTTPDRFAGRMDDLRRVAEESGRDPTSLDVGLFYIDMVDPAPQAAEGGRRPLTGAPADVAADLDAFARAGVGTMILIFQRPGLGETLDRMSWFAEEVMPLARGGAA